MGWALALLLLTYAGTEEPCQTGVVKDGGSCERSREGLNSTDGRARWAAVRDLGKMGASAACAVADLRLALRQDPWDSVRREAVRAIGAIGRKAIDALPDLVAAGLDPDIDPSWVTDAIVQLGPEAIPKLVTLLPEALESPEPQTPEHGRPSSVAAVALARIGPPAVPALIEAARDRKTRTRALSALAQMGAAAAPAVEALVDIYADEQSVPGTEGEIGVLMTLVAIGDPACAARELVERALRTASEDVRLKRWVEILAEQSRHCK